MSMAGTIEERELRWYDFSQNMKMHTRSKDNGNINFNTSSSALATIMAVNQRFNKTGSVEDLPRTSRPAIVLTEQRN